MSRCGNRECIFNRGCQIGLLVCMVTDWEFLYCLSQTLIQRYSYYLHTKYIGPQVQIVCPDTEECPSKSTWVSQDIFNFLGNTVTSVRHHTNCQLKVVYNSGLNHCIPFDMMSYFCEAGILTIATTKEVLQYENQCEIGNKGWQCPI